MSQLLKKPYVMEDVMEVCTEIYHTVKDCGYYPGLTGGVLYKDGVRKDVDILMYEKEAQTVVLMASLMLY